MQEVRKIDKKSLARVLAVFYGLSGVAVFLAIIITSVVSIILTEVFPGSVFKLILFNIGFGLVLGIGVGLAASAIGGAIGYVIASIYNLLAANFGGLMFELRDNDIATVKPETEEKAEDEIVIDKYLK